MRRTNALLVGMLVALGSAAQVASGANQVVLGKTFLVVNRAAADPARRRIKVSAREPAGTASIVGDPTVAGAMLFVVASNDAPPPEEGIFFPLPAAGWTATATGFAYRDTSGVLGAVKTAVVRDNGRSFQIKVALGPRAPLAIPVLPPPQGTNGGATLTLGGGDAYCMRFGGPAGGTVKNVPRGVGGKLFKVTKPTAEAGCVQCGDVGGGMCGGACGPQQFCTNLGGSCGCLFIFGTTTFTTTSTSTSTSTTTGSPSAAFVDPGA